MGQSLGPLPASEPLGGDERVTIQVKVLTWDLGTSNGNQDPLALASVKERGMDTETSADG